MPFNDPPWVPMTNPVDLKHIGKLGEESVELAKVCFRASIQGIDGIDPTTGRTNREDLVREMGDVWANMKLCSIRWGIPVEAIVERANSKIGNLHRWHNALDPANG